MEARRRAGAYDENKTKTNHCQRATKNILTEDLHKAADRGLVLGVDKDQVLGEEEANDVVHVHLINGDAGVAGLENLGNNFEG